MENIHNALKAAKKIYDSGKPSATEGFALAHSSLSKLAAEATLKDFGKFRGRPSLTYQVFASQCGISRPFLCPPLIRSADEFRAQTKKALRLLSSGELIAEHNIQLITNVIYTSVMAFASCYDIWKPNSRKTPGTFFEVLMGGLFRHHLPHCALSKHVKLTALAGEVDSNGEETGAAEYEDKTNNGDGTDAGNNGSVSTDLVITSEDGARAAIIPLKITTRERIVQPFAHQRVLDSICPNRFTSFLACISEVQRDNKKSSVKQICVPGAIKLFQKHLGQLRGIYYCDIPQRYAAADLTAILPVKPLGCIFNDVRKFLITS